MRTSARTILTAILAVILLLALTACGGGNTPAQTGDTGEAAEATAPETEAEPETEEAEETVPIETLPAEIPPEPITPGPMNELNVIFENINAQLASEYEKDPEAIPVEVPAYFSGESTMLEIQYMTGWSMGDISTRFDDSGAVEQLEAYIRDTSPVSAVAAAVYGSCMEGMTIEAGLAIAAALKVGDADSAPDEYITYVLDYSGYYYTYEKAESFIVGVMPNDAELYLDECVFFDMGGNEVAGPAG